MRSPSFPVGCGSSTQRTPCAAMDQVSCPFLQEERLKEASLDLFSSFFLRNSGSILLQQCPEASTQGLHQPLQIGVPAPANFKAHFWVPPEQDFKAPAEGQRDSTMERALTLYVFSLLDPQNPI